MTLRAKPRYSMPERTTPQGDSAAQSENRLSSHCKLISVVCFLKFGQLSRLPGSTRLSRLNVPVETFTPPYMKSRKLIFFGSFNISLRLTFCLGLTLVVELLTLAKTNRYLYSRSRKVETERYQSVTFLRNVRKKLQYLTLVHQQFAVAPRFTVENVAFFVWTYVDTAGENLAVSYKTKRIFQVDLSCAYAFYFSAEKSNSGFVRILDEIVVVRFFILGNYSARFFIRRKNSSFPTN